jgi:DICT domain-containing protein
MMALPLLDRTTNRVFASPSELFALEGPDAAVASTGSCTTPTAVAIDDVDLRTAQTRLGHSDPRLTLAVYAQASTAADRAAADSLGAHFFGGSRDIRGMESA